MEMNWSFFGVWNESALNREERKLSPRTNIWASELGGSLLDRYLKMTGVEPSNPFDARSLRKFEAGNIWEWIVGLVLQRAGILMESQGWVTYQYEGLSPVTGKLDYKAGGKPDWEKARAEFETGFYPDFIASKAKAIIDSLSAKFPDGLKPIVLEIKSTSQFMFDKYEKTGGCDPKHRLQLFHYLKSTEMDEGHIVYICKDDSRMIEVGVFNPSVTEEEYRRDIEAITMAVRYRNQPKPEPELVWMDDTFRFAANWKVEYSPYLTAVYGYKTGMEFREKYDKVTAQWNRVLGRCVKGERMTPLNLEVIGEIKKSFPNFDEMIEAAKKAKPVLEELSTSTEEL